MGSSRPDDSGRKDTLGRIIRLGRTSERASEVSAPLDARKDFSSHPSLSSPPPAPERTPEFCHEVSQWLLDNAEGREPIFATVHGSYLYGTAHEGSDLDLYMLVKDGKNTSSVHHGLDVQVYNLDTFARLVKEGSHQAVEALYSPYRADSDSPWMSYVNSLRPDPYVFYRKCVSAGKAMAARGDDKGVRHQRRLAESAEAMVEGDYSPVWREFDA